MEYKAKQMVAIAEILKSYTEDDGGGCWQVAYSGGKDSSVLTAILFKALLMLKPEQRKRKVYITTAQTNLDLTTDPTKQREIMRMRKVITLFNLPVEIVEVEGETEDNLLYLIVGMGYPLATKGALYCTDRMKLEPQAKWERENQPAKKLLGVRRSETTQRGESVDKHLTSEFYGVGNVFMPIVHFTLDDIWGYLALEKTPWGDAEEVSQLYKDATGECGLSKRKAGKGEKVDDPCGARFGCIICPVVTIDKSTREMAKKFVWYQPYAETRDIMIEMYKKPQNKAGYMRNGQETFYGEGTFTIKARMELFDLFMTAQVENERLATKYGAEPQPILTEKLIAAIKRQWEKDRIDSPWLEDAVEIGMFFEQRPKGVKGRKGIIPGQITWNEKFVG